MLRLFESLCIHVPKRHALATGYVIEGRKVGIGLVRGQHHFNARAIALPIVDVAVAHPAQIQSFASTDAGPGAALNSRPAWAQGVLR